MSASTSGYSRVLSTYNTADYFLRNALHLDEGFSSRKFAKAVMDVADVEMHTKQVLSSNTLVSADYRSPEYRTENKRIKLRQKILFELKNHVRLDDDDKIKMGSGGALPKTVLKRQKKAFYIIGLPASGKSEIAARISDEYGAMILDSDYAKRKFPEYRRDYGATVVHKESSLIVFGAPGKYASEESLIKYALENEFNIVIPKIGNVSSEISELAEVLSRINYEVHLILVRLDREKAVKRAFKRFSETKRYVPLSMIFDVYSNEPTITFYDLLHNDKFFSSYTMISSDVPWGSPKQIIYTTDVSLLQNIHL